MRATHITTLLTLAVLTTAAPSNQKEKPSIMLGIKRSVVSSTSTTTVSSTSEPEASTTKAPLTKKPYADTFVKIPEKPLYEKKPAKPVKVAEIAKKSEAVPEAEVLKKVDVRSEVAEAAEVPIPEAVEQASSIPDVPGVSEEQLNYTDQFESDKPKQNSTVDSTTDVYDNSQHGKENYRVHLKGFTLLVAPSETILGAAMIMSGLEDKENSVQPNGNKENKMQRQKDSFARLMQFLHGYKKHESQ